MQRKLNIWVFSGVLVAAATVLVLEFTLRRMATADAGSRNVYTDLATIVPHPYLIHTSKPNVRTEQLTINSLGFRGNEFIPEKASGTFRIVAIGGSDMFGWSAQSDAATIPAALERILRQRYPERSIEVINAGRRWYTSTQKLILYETVVSDLDPDAVVYMGGYTGLMHGTTTDVPAGQSVLWYDRDLAEALHTIISTRLAWSDITRPFKKIVNASAVVRAIRARTTDEIESWRTKVDVHVVPDEQQVRLDVVAVFLRNLSYLIAVTSSDHVPLVFALRPLADEWIDAGGTGKEGSMLASVRRGMDEIRERIPALLIADVTYLDLASLGQDRRFYQDRGQLTEAAYERIAQEFADALRPYLEP